MAWRQYQALLQQIETGVLVVDSNRRIHEANPAAQRLLGARIQGLIGRSLVEATLSYEVLSLLSAAQESGQPQERELRRNEMTGRTLRVQVFPLPSEGEATEPETEAPMIALSATRPANVPSEALEA